MKDWSKERWRKLYLRESAEQRGDWPLMARGLRDYLIRVAEDDGRIVSAGGLQRAVKVLGAHESEAELALQAFEILLADDFIRLDATGAVFVVKLPEAQADASGRPRVATEPGPGSPTPPDKPRGRWAGTTPEQRSEAARLAANARYGRKGDAEPTQPVTQGDAGSDAAGDAFGSRAVSGQNQGSESLDSQKDQKEKRDLTHARTHGDARSDADEVTHHVSLSHEGISLQEASKLWLTNAQEAQLGAPDPHTWPAVLSVAEQLDQVFPPPGRDPRTKRALHGWQDSRVRVIVERFAEGSTLTELRDAVAGAALDSHIQRNPQFQSISNILKSAEQVERFRRLFVAGGEKPRPAPAGARAHAPKQPNGGTWTPPVER